jgi:hypothetical protein
LAGGRGVAAILVLGKLERQLAGLAERDLLGLAIDPLVGVEVVLQRRELGGQIEMAPGQAGRRRPRRRCEGGE